MFLAQKQLHCTENQFKTTFPEFWTISDSFGQLSSFRAHFGFETADGTNCSRSGDSSFDLSSRDKNLLLRIFAMSAMMSMTQTDHAQSA